MGAPGQDFLQYKEAGAMITEVGSRDSNYEVRGLFIIYYLLSGIYA